MLLLVLLFGVSLSLSTPQYKPWTGYDGYQVWEVTPSSKEQVIWLHEMQEDLQLDTLGVVRSIGVPVEILIPPVLVDDLHKMITFLNIQYTEVTKDYQSDLNAEWKRQADRREGWTKKAFDLDDFNTLDEIMDEMEEMVSRCPAASGVLCDLYDVGLSYEGRPIKVLRIRKDEEDRDAFWIDSAIHSGEWVAPATNLKLLDRMTRFYDSDEVVRDFIDRYDWYFLPVMNPDGYEWTWTDNRNWRKSRNVNEGSECIGTDLNRNYDQEWMNAGTSANPCSGNYGGNSSASAPETQVIQAEFHRLSSTLRGLVSIHTSGQMWLHPFGHVDAQGDCFYAEDEDWLISISNQIADAIQGTFDTVWRRGNICDTIYPASGSTVDYAKAAAGIRYAATPELRGPATPENIDLSYQEVWNGIVAMVNALDEE